MCPLCIETHSELPPGARTYNGIIVIEGCFVSDQRSKVLVFGELASSALLMPAPKMIDIVGCHIGWTIQQFHAQQAYTQSKLNMHRQVDVLAG